MGAYCAELSKKLPSVIKEKRRRNLRRGLMHHRDSAQARMSIVAMTTICQYGFELLHHLPYSVDLATSDFHLFKSVEESLCGQIFESVENVKCAKNDQFERLDEIFFVAGVKACEIVACCT